MNRSTLILFLLLIALGAIAYFIIPSSQERESSDKTPEVSFSVDSASVVKIAMIRGLKSVTLENVGGKWMITSPGKYAADPAAVLQVLQSLSKFKIGSLISSNPEKQKLFQVDSSGTQIAISDRSGKTNAIIIGKMGPSFSEVYCRLPGSKNVFLGEGLDSWTVNKEAKDWRDKSITAIPSESVKSLTYAMNNRQYEYVRDSSSWKLGETTVETGIMNPPLTSLANLRADDFIDTAMHFTSQPVGVSVKGSENVALQLYPSLPDSSRYYVQSSASPQLYVISKYTAQQLLRPIDHSAGHPKTALKSPFAKKEEAPKETPPITTVHKEEKIPPPPVTAAKKNIQQPPAQTPVSPSKSAQTEAMKNPQQKNNAAKNPPLTDQKKSNPATTPAAPGTKGAPPASGGASGANKSAPTEKTKPAAADDEGDLTVYTVKAGDTMPMIARKNGCSVEQILKWNLLKSINVKPGQELYIYVKK